MSLKKYVGSEFYGISGIYWTSEDVNKFMDKVSEYDDDFKEEIKEVDHDDLLEMIYEGNFEAVREVAESMRKTMIFNAKKVIAEICRDISYDELEAEEIDNGISNNDRLMGEYRGA